LLKEVCEKPKADSYFVYQVVSFTASEAIKCKLKIDTNKISITFFII
jgi:hypothetical protein